MLCCKLLQLCPWVSISAWQWWKHAYARQEVTPIHSQCTVRVCCQKHNLLCWLSQVSGWWCILHRLKEYVPPMYTRDSGFESIAELLNILRLGNLRVVATKDIPPCTEVVMDYFIQRSCFHASGTCATRESPSFQCFKYSLSHFLKCILCASFSKFCTRKALLSRAVCEVLVLFQRYSSGLPHETRLWCSWQWRSFLLCMHCDEKEEAINFLF